MTITKEAAIAVRFVVTAVLSVILYIIPNPNIKHKHEIELVFSTA